MRKYIYYSNQKTPNFFLKQHTEVMNKILIKKTETSKTKQKDFQKFG